MASDCDSDSKSRQYLRWLLDFAQDRIRHRLLNVVLLRLCYLILAALNLSLVENWYKEIN